MQRTILALAVLIAMCRTSLAASHTFQDQNFAIELPASWQVINPAPAQTVIAAKRPDDTKSMVAAAVKVLASEASTFAGGMANGAKQGAKDKGWQIADEQETSIDGMPFHRFTTRIPTGASMVTYIGLAGDECYMLQGVCAASDAGSDAEIQGIVNSFRLLSPRSFPSKSNSSKSAGYRAGYVFGRLTVIAVVGLGVVWLIRRVTASKAR